MKRLVLTLILVFTAAGFVFAQSNAGAAQQNNKGAYYNCPYPDCPLCTGGVYGPGMGKGGRGGKGMAMGEPVIVTTDQAKNAVEKYNLDNEVTLAGSFCIGKCNRIGVTIQIDDDIFTGVTPDSFESFFNENVLTRLEKESE